MDKRGNRIDCSATSDNTAYTLRLRVVSRINFTYITLAHPSTSVRTQGSVPAAGDTRTHGQVRHSRDCYAA